MAESDDDPRLSLTERQLTRIASRGQVDEYLVDLVRRAETVGGGGPLVVLTNGMVIAGWVGSGRAMAERLDEEFVRLINMEGSSMSDDERRSAEEKLGSANAEMFDRAKGRRDVALEKIEELGEKAPGSVQLDGIIANNPAILTLLNAHITAPGVQGKTSAPVMRIPLHAISGWWLPDDTDYRAEGQSFRMSLWEPNE